MPLSITVRNRSVFFNAIKKNIHTLRLKLHKTFGFGLKFVPLF